MWDMKRGENLSGVKASWRKWSSKFSMPVICLQYVQLVYRAPDTHRDKAVCQECAKPSEFNAATVEESFEVG